MVISEIEPKIIVSGYKDNITSQPPKGCSMDETDQVDFNVPGQYYDDYFEVY